MQIIVYEDEPIPRLYPITVSRPGYAITCGAYRLIDWLTLLRSDLGATLRGIVRPHLTTLQQIDYPQFSAPPPGEELPALLVSARAVPSVDLYHALKKIVAEGRSGVLYHGDAPAAIYVGRGDPAPPSSSETAKFHDYVAHLARTQTNRLEGAAPLFDWPHDLVRWNMQIIAANLEHRLRSGHYREASPGVFLAPGAELGQYCIADTSKGPVILDEGATVGHYTFLRGPAYLGPRARVLEHSAIKDCVSLGHTTKIGGEVEAAVVEPYSNKQHHGFLGHAYLGSWINLGAGTCNSDLKNTYGAVKMDYRGESVATGMQFIGCIVGDYAKTAINTSIFTGKTIGCCSMVYGFVTTNVPSFVNYARVFGQVTELPPEVMIATQQRMFARRQVAQRPCDTQLLHAMYDLTRHERQLAGEPLSL